MRAEADKLKAGFIRLAVDQDEVGLDVAVAVIVPFAGKRVIEIPPGQRLVLRQQCHSFQESGVEALAVPSRFFLFVIAPEIGWCA